MKERLQKILAQAGVASRRNAEKLIAAGRVAVDGKAITELGAKVEAADVRITVDGKPLPAQEAHVYFLLNKPKGYITTAHDDRGRRTVLDLLPEVKERIYPVGRLDNNTEGLLLLTNDGALTNGLLHPKQEVDKTYVARVQPVPTEQALVRLTEGVKLEDGMTAPALVRLLSSDGDEARVEIHGANANELRKLDLYEVSLVQIPANEHAELIDVKSADDGTDGQDGSDGDDGGAMDDGAEDGVDTDAIADALDSMQSAFGEVEQAIQSAIDEIKQAIGGDDPAGDSDGDEDKPEEPT